MTFPVSKSADVGGGMAFSARFDSRKYPQMKGAFDAQSTLI